MLLIACNTRCVLQASLAMALALPFPAAAQVAPVTKNNFTGTAGFGLVTPGSVVDSILTIDFGMDAAYFTATGVSNTSLRAQNNTPGSPKVAPRVGRPYTVSAEADNGGLGSASYSLSAYAFFGVSAPGKFRNFFQFNGPTPNSNPLILAKLPALATLANFQECVGIIEVKLGSNSCTAPTTPIFVKDPSISSIVNAARSTTSSLGLTSVLRHIAKPAAGQKFTLRYTTGSDPFSDLIQNEISFQETVSCDVVTPVCLGSTDLPGTGSCTGASCPPGGNALGKIIGKWDVVNRLENANSLYTFIVGFNGPFDNYRYDTIGGEPGSPNPPIFAGPPRAFELENLVPGNDYRIYGETNARLDRQYEFIRSDRVSRAVIANQTTNLGNTFVMTPATIYGEVYLAHFPPAGKPPSGLYDLYFSDAGPANKFVPSSPDLGTGSRLSLSSNGSISYTAWPYEEKTKPPKGGIDRSFAQTTLGVLSSNYDLSVVRANDVNGNAVTGQWPDTGKAHFELRFGSDGIVKGTAPLPRPNGRVDIAESVAAQALAPNASREIPFQYCFGTVHVRYVATTGTLYNPSAVLKGTFKGTLTALDQNNTTLFSRNADYTVDANFIGIPQNVSNKASTGDLVMTLPKGEYTLTPTVNVDDGSLTTFNPIKITPPLECNEHREISVGVSMPCDIDGNGKIDRLDIEAIFKNRGKRASGAGDPMDVNNDGTISVNDARICTLRCTNPGCAP